MRRLRLPQPACCCPVQRRRPVLNFNCSIAIYPVSADRLPLPHEVAYIHRRLQSRAPPQPERYLLVSIGLERAVSSSNAAPTLRDTARYVPTTRAFTALSSSRCCPRRRLTRISVRSTLPAMSDNTTAKIAKHGHFDFPPSMSVRESYPALDVQAFDVPALALLASDSVH